jgi:hydrogenase nickel incorporation protein HypA/HybF
MHELGLASDVLHVCETSLAAHGRGRIEKVRLAVGELSAVEPDLLRFAWEAVIAETLHAGAELEIEWRRARQLCPRCGEQKQRSSGSWLRLCPDCGHALRIEGGDELDVIDLQVELQAEQPQSANAGGRVDGQDG